MSPMLCTICVCVCVCVCVLRLTALRGDCDSLEGQRLAIYPKPRGLASFRQGWPCQLTQHWEAFSMQNQHRSDHVLASSKFLVMLLML